MAPGPAHLRGARDRHWPSRSTRNSPSSRATSTRRRPATPGRWSPTPRRPAPASSPGRRPPVGEAESPVRVLRHRQRHPGAGADVRVRRSTRAPFEPCASPRVGPGPASPARTPSASAPSTWPATSTRRPPTRTWTVVAGAGHDDHLRARPAAIVDGAPAADAEHERERDLRVLRRPARLDLRVLAGRRGLPALHLARSAFWVVESGSHEFEVRATNPELRRRGAAGRLRVAGRARPGHDRARTRRSPPARPTRRHQQRRHVRLHRQRQPHACRRT